MKITVIILLLSINTISMAFTLHLLRDNAKLQREVIEITIEKDTIERRGNVVPITPPLKKKVRI